MNFFERALLSIRAKKGKSLLMFIIFFAIFSLIFIGFNIQDATKQNEIKARQKLGADVSLKLDQTKLQDIFQSRGDISPISQEALNQYSKLKEVKGYQVSISATANKDKLEPFPAQSTDSQSTVVSSDGTKSTYNPSFTLTGVRESDYNDDFKNKNSKLIEGKPITADDKNATAIIEKQLAKKNNLKVGDSFTLKTKDDQEVRFKVKGIYETDKTVDSNFASMEMALPENDIYVNYQAAEKFSQGGIKEATFYLKDPLMIKDFLREAKKLNLVSSTYKFDAHDQAYEQLVGPLKQVGSICSSLVVVSLVVGLLILSTIILLNIKNRKFEMGVLLALGESKFKITSQLLIETILIAIIAFGLSSIASGPIGQTVANINLSEQVQEANSRSQQSQQTSSGVIMANQDGSENKKYAPIDTIKIDPSSKTIRNVSVISLLIVLLSTLIPSLFILRLNPKVLFQNKE